LVYFCLVLFSNRENLAWIKFGISTLGRKAWNIRQADKAALNLVRLNKVIKEKTIDQAYLLHLEHQLVLLA